jgi:hypothetical protein
MIIFLQNHCYDLNDNISPEFSRIEFFNPQNNDSKRRAFGELLDHECSID